MIYEFTAIVNIELNFCALFYGLERANVTIICVLVYTVPSLEAAAELAQQVTSQRARSEVAPQLEG